MEKGHSWHFARKYFKGFPELSISLWGVLRHEYHFAVETTARE